jgi:hypothetical protein
MLGGEEKGWKGKRRGGGDGEAGVALGKERARGTYAACVDEDELALL